MLIDRRRGEGAFGGSSPADAKGTLKCELHRDMIIPRPEPSLASCLGGEQRPTMALAMGRLACAACRKYGDSLSPRATERPGRSV